MHLFRFFAVTLSQALALFAASSSSAEIVGLAGISCPSATFTESVIRIDSATGNRAVLSGLDPSGPGGTCTLAGNGPPLLFASALALSETGDYFVSDGTDVNFGAGAARLLRVDASSGDRTVFSGCDDPDEFDFGCLGETLGEGPILGWIESMAVVSVELAVANPTLSGLVGSAIIAAQIPDCESDSVNARTLLTVDAATGDRSIISGTDADCGFAGLGDPFRSITGIAITSDGSIWVGDGFYDGNNDVEEARLFRVDIASGDRTIVSGCDQTDEVGFFSSVRCVGSVVGSGSPINYIGDLVVPTQSPGRLLIQAANYNSTCPGGGFGESIQSVELSTGKRTVISGDNDGCAVVGVGPNFLDMDSLAAGADGSLIAGVFYGGTKVLRVDPLTGNRTVLTGCTAEDDTFLNACDPPATYVGSGPRPSYIYALLEASTAQAVPEPNVATGLLSAIAMMLGVGRQGKARA